MLVFTTDFQNSTLHRMNYANQDVQVDIMIMFPEGKVSPVQEAQMTSV